MNYHYPINGLANAMSLVLVSAVASLEQRCAA
jgi:hypothetical protein